MAKRTKSREINKPFVGLLGRKLGMTQVFAPDGTVTAVSVVEAGPCSVVQIKTQSSDGYDAIQIGFLERAAKKVNKSRVGHFKKANVTPKAHTRELRQTAKSVTSYQVGQELKASIFNSGDLIDVVGTSIGKGFQGVMKRHNMKGADHGHGSHEAFRHGGSLGTRFPQRVARGKPMPGHMGNTRSSILNLKVVDVRPDQNLLFIKGAIPGKKNCLLLVRKAVKAKVKAA